MSAVIGYWGYGLKEEVETLLAGSVRTACGPEAQALLRGFESESDSENDRGKRALFSGVSCWGPHARLSRYSEGEREFSVSISVSGIPEIPDSTITATGNSLRLARDSFGRATLFWTRVSDLIWFSSRIELLLPFLQNREVSIEGLHGYACLSFVPAPLSPIAGVFAVEAGAEQVWQAADFLETNPSGRTRREHGWNEAETQITDENDAAVQLRRLLEAAICSQLEALPSGPVGVYLSGGLDSAITAALLVRAGVSVRGYTLDLGEHSLSEIPFAELVAKSLGIPLVRVAATPQEVRRAIAATARALDLPFGDSVTVPLFLLTEAASRETAVVFNGEGGDQLFAGWTNKPLIAMGVYRSSHPEAADFERGYMRTFHRLHGHERSVYQPAVLDEVYRLSPSRWLAAALDASFTDSLLHRLRRANLMLKGAQNIQPRATALALNRGIMLRTPFCYRPLADWTFRLAGDLCLRGACEKYLLKRAVEDWLPPEIVWREKRGMGVPLTAWCLGPLWATVGQWLKPEILKAEGRWQADIAFCVASGQLSGHVQGRRIGEILWLLLMWQAWRRTVLNEGFKQSFYNPFWLPPRWWQWRFRERLHD